MDKSKESKDMPELPEVETVMQGLAPVMINKEIVRVDIARRDLRVVIPDGFESVLVGTRVEAFIRRGKYMILELANGRAVVWHLGMSGRALILSAKDAAGYELQKHDHASIFLIDGTRVVFNDARRFGCLYLSAGGAEGWRDDKPFALMGPEPLGNNFNGSVLYERLRAKKTAIKVALMDQRVVVGVGNIYACEALYRAQISPFISACSLSEGDCEALVVAVRDILKEAIKAGGSTLRDHRQADGSLGYFQHQFFVYDREGQACGAVECAKLSDEGCVLRAAQGGRSTFYCENVQA